MKLIYIGTLPPHKGGSAIASSGLLLRLAKIGWDVRCVSPVFGELTPEVESQLAPLSPLRYPVDFLETSPGGVVPVGHREHEARNVRELTNRLIADERPDILFAGRENFTITALELAEDWSLPLVARLAGLMTNRVVAGEAPIELASDWLQAIRRVDRVVSLSGDMQDGLQSLGVERIEVIANGVDLDLFRPMPKSAALLLKLGIPADANVMMHVSNLKPVKRPLDFIHAAARVATEEPGTFFVVVGDGSERGAMEELARRKGLAERIRFTGWLPHTMLPEYMNLADVISMSSASEGQAAVYLETQACGKVLLASDIPSAREVVEDGETGLLFPTGQPEQLANRALQVLRDTDLRRRIGEQARTRVAAHSFDRIASRWDALMTDIVERRQLRV